MHQESVSLEIPDYDFPASAVIDTVAPAAPMEIDVAPAVPAVVSAAPEVAPAVESAPAVIEFSEVTHVSASTMVQKQAPSEEQVAVCFIYQRLFCFVFVLLFVCC